MMSAPNDKSSHGISSPVRRREDVRFVTGRGRYTNDIDVPGQAHAAFVRSDHAHGTLRGVDIEAAMKMPGVVGILTGDDLLRAGVGFIRRIPLKGFELGKTLDTPRPGLAQGRVRYVGEPVALVIAETAAQAADAASVVSVDVEPLPCVTGVEDAVTAGAPTIWSDAPNNIAIQWQSGSTDSIDAVFAEAAHVTRMKLVNTRIFANAIEPRAGIAQYDARTDKYTWITPSQGVRYMVRVLCDQVFKISDEKMHVLTYDVGGAFGSKEQPYPEDVALLHAARAVGRTIKWHATRSENLLSDNHARDAVIECALALDSKGRFLAIRASILASMGAYFGCNGPNGTIRNTPWGMPLVYRTPMVHAEMKAVMTNTAPIGPYRGAGREQASYIVERLVDKAAWEMDIDRISLRRRNLIPASAIPYRSPSGRLYDSGEFEAVMDKALGLADWKGFSARAKASKKRGLIRGLGVANFLECVGGSWQESSFIRFTDDRRILLVVATQSHGQGHETSFPQVVADRLGVPYDVIELRQGDSADLPTAGLRDHRLSLHDHGRIGAVEHVRNRHREGPQGGLALSGSSGGRYRVSRWHLPGSGYRPLHRFVRSRQTRPPRCEQRATGRRGTGLRRANILRPTCTSPTVVTSVRSTSIRNTGKITVDRYVAVDDVGTIVNPPIVHGQVHGGVCQGMGQVLMEHCQYSEDGQFLTGSFMDYAMPRAADVPSMDTAFHPVPSPKNPLGVKGSGECGVTGSLPAVTNAIWTH